MLSWIATPGSASVHADLMSEQVPDATTLAKFRHSLERRGLGKAMLHDLNSELEKAGITARGGSIVGVTFIWALKLNEEQRPCARPLKRTSPRKGEPGVSDTRRISA
jgi:IS5 family transposase